MKTWQLLRLFPTPTHITPVGFHAAAGRSGGAGEDGKFHNENCQITGGKALKYPLSRGLDSRGEFFTPAATAPPASAVKQLKASAWTVRSVLVDSQQTR